MKNRIAPKAGMSYVKTAVLALVFVMILTAVLAFWSTMTVIQRSRDITSRVLDSFVLKNSIEIYDSLKNGNDYSESLDNIFYKSSLSEEFSLDLYGSSMYSYSEDGELVFIMTNPNVIYSYQNTLKLKASYTVWIPLRFAGRFITYVRIPVTVRSYYTLKY